MRLFFDLDAQQFVVGAGTTQPLLSISVKRSPNALIQIQFLRRVTPQELSAGATGIFEVKETGKYDANAIFRAGSWVKTGTGEDTIYTFTLDVQNAAGDTLLGAEDPVVFTRPSADTLSAAASPAIGSIIQVETTGTLPAGLTVNRDYFVITAGHNSTDWKVSLTSEGTPVSITSAGTGTHKFRKISDDVKSIPLMSAMQYVADGNTVESQDVDFIYHNDIIRDADTSVPAVPEDVVIAVRTGLETIANGTDTGSVVFDSPFTGGSTVAIVPGVHKPTGGDNILAVIDGGTVTVNGFDYFLTAPVPATGYKLSYIATAV